MQTNDYSLLKQIGIVINSLSNDIKRNNITMVQLRNENKDRAVSYRNGANDANRDAIARLNIILQGVNSKDLTDKLLS